MMDLKNSRPANYCRRNILRAKSLVIAACSVLRNLPLVFASRPQTPLRVLCIMAFDALHQIRTTQRLASDRIQMLAAMLDLGACANAAFDQKKFCRKRFDSTRQFLIDTRHGSSANEYWQLIQQLERGRPRLHDNARSGLEVREYREAVARLSLGVLSATAFGLKSIEDGIQAVRFDEDLAVVFRIVMQCQIIDDVFDYSKDIAFGLPGFLTGSESLLEAFQMTSDARKDYATVRRTSHSDGLFPFTVTLFAVSVLASILLTAGRWRQRIPSIKPVKGIAAGPL